MTEVQAAIVLFFLPYSHLTYSANAYLAIGWHGMYLTDN